MYCILRVQNNISDVIFIKDKNKLLEYCKLAIESISVKNDLLELHGPRYNHKSSWKINLLDFANNNFSLKEEESVKLKDIISQEIDTNKKVPCWKKFKFSYS